MAENNNQQITRHSTRKSHSHTTSSVLQPKKSSSPPNGPTNKENSDVNPSRSRQLWNLAVESVRDHEKSTLASVPMVSSNVSNEPIEWYNLTKR